MEKLTVKKPNIRRDYLYFTALIMLIPMHFIIVPPTTLPRIIFDTVMTVILITTLLYTVGYTYATAIDVRYRQYKYRIKENNRTTNKILYKKSTR